MIINRHNYEECFILYWDNELTLSQKQAVETFVKENADLQDEFKLLGETRFTPDNNIQFEEKEFLLNDSFINITNYEEQLLNYIDDEVTADQRKEVEKFAGLYPAVQKELSLLQKTKLQPEAEVVYPDKATLYRKEEKARVISMTWFRVAVAAAIILIAGFATFKLVSTNAGGGKVDIAKDTEIKTKPADQSNDQPLVTPGDKLPANDQPDVVKLKSKTEAVQPEKKYQRLPNSNNTIASKQPENKNNLPQERKITDQQPENTGTLAQGDIADIHMQRDTRTTQTNQSDVINADFADQDVTLKANPTLYIPKQEEKEGGGIKEFLRKTTRVFERRTRIQTTTDDNKLLVGAFAVSLK